jgi:hypothetical protein
VDLDVTRNDPRIRRCRAGKFIVALLNVLLFRRLQMNTTQRIFNDLGSTHYKGAMLVHRSFIGAILDSDQGGGQWKVFGVGWIACRHHETKNSIARLDTGLKSETRPNFLVPDVRVFVSIMVHINQHSIRTPLPFRIPSDRGVVEGVRSARMICCHFRRRRQQHSDSET